MSIFYAAPRMSKAAYFDAVFFTGPLISRAG